MTLFAFENARWSVFWDSGCLQSIPAQSWLDFAKGDSFFLANYNAATFSAEVIAIESGRILREFLYDKSLEETVDVGRLPGEEVDPIEGWLQVAKLIDNDSHLLWSDRVWLLGPAPL